MAQFSWTKYLRVNDLVEQIDEGIAVLDRSMRIQFANNYLAQMLGYAPEELVGTPFQLLRNDEKGMPFVDGCTEECTLPLRTRDGKDIPVRARIRPLDESDHGWYVFISRIDPFKGRVDPDFYKALAHAAPRMAIVGPDLRIRFMNVPLTGFKDEDMMGMSILDGVQPEYRSGLQDAVEAVFEEGIPGSFEMSETGDGSQENWVVLSISPIRVGNKVESVVMTGTDITERVLAEQALRESELKYRSIIEQSLIGIVIILPDPVKLLFANTQLCEMLGYSPSELQSMDVELISNLVYHEDTERIGKYFRACVEQEELGELIQVRLNNKAGYQTWVELSAGKIEYQSRVALQISIVDITKRREMEEVLIRSEHRVKTLLQSLTDIVIVHDENDCYAEVFTGSPELLFTSPENYLGHHITDVLPKDIALEYLHAVQEVRRTQTSTHLDYPLEIGGITHWFSANMSLHEDKQSVVVAVRDISKRHEAQETLNRERRIFRELAHTFIHTEDIDALGKRFLNIIADSFEFDFGVFGLFDSKSNILRKTCSIGEYYDGIQSEILVNDASSDTFLVGQVFKKKESVFVSDVEHELPTRPYLTRIFNHGGRSTLAFPILDEKGEVIGIASFASRTKRIYTDDDKELFSTIANMLGTAIEQKKADVALKISERRYRELLSDISEGVGIWDLDENILFANRSFAKILSYPSEDLIGVNLRDLIDPSDAHKLEQQTNQRMSDLPSTYEILFISRNNEKRLCRVSSVPSRDDNDTVDGAVAIVTDITEQVKAEEALRESEVRFRSIFESTPVGMHLHELSDDGQLILTDANRAADIVLRENHDELIGKPIELALPKRHQGSNIVERCYDVMRTGIPWSVERTIERDSKVVGGLKIQVFRTSPKTMVTSFLDISERVVAEMEVRKLNEELSKRVEERTAELAAANKELEAFAYSVSHDLRAPLRTIDGFSQALLEDYYENIDETGRDYLQRLRAAANRMSSLIEDILSLSRVTRGEMERSSVNLSEIAHEIIDDLRGIEPNRAIDIHIEETIPIRCDRRLMKIVLQNLIGNAWKFTRDVAKAKIEFSMEEQDGKPVFIVRDNGAGFDMKYKERLFAPFQRLHQPEEFEGSGIGLATVQRILNRHGGTIWAESKVNEGATFCFTLPEIGDAAK
jgi:PAS domain S-box-containing protein